MALANIGARLAQTGRKVLLVDFDLEAPGLGTYDFPKPDTDTPGVVEFIIKYLETNKAPKVNDYLYHSPGFGKNGGELWLMPAGIQDDSYAGKFAQIDWQDLYENRNGFLLLEDLKQQWEKELSPDYVLIDSRTGHSDVVGICTRQLPDAVVLMMFPNAQNLVGLRKVVADIRSQDQSPGGKETKLHFVVSNVPDLDDENQILANTFEQFREQLEYKTPSAIIHRYQSLSLLNQEIFAVTRPRTRLAAEYFKLLDELAKYNDEDKEGALSFLDSTLRASRYSEYRLGAAELQRRVDRIASKHRNDKDILFKLGKVSDRQGKEERALDLYNAAYQEGLQTTELLISMARLQDDLGNNKQALDSIRELLQSEELSYFDFSVAAEILSRVAPDELSTINSSPALLSMDSDDQVQVARRLADIKGAFDVSEMIFQRLRSEGRASADDGEGSLELVLGRINHQRYDDAIEELSLIHDDDESSMSEIINFNLAMANWGKEGKPDPEIFQRVIDVEDLKAKDVNYVQCMSIAYFVVGNTEEARKRLNKAKRMLSNRPMGSFSAWTYDEVSPRDFKEHLLEIQKMIEGEEILPRVFRKT